VIMFAILVAARVHRVFHSWSACPPALVARRIGELSDRGFALGYYVGRSLADCQLVPLLLVLPAVLFRHNRAGGSSTHRGPSGSPFALPNLMKLSVVFGGQHRRARGERTWTWRHRIPRRLPNGAIIAARYSLGGVF